MTCSADELVRWIASKSQLPADFWLCIQLKGVEVAVEQYKMYDYPLAPLKMTVGKCFQAVFVNDDDEKEEISTFKVVQAETEDQVCIQWYYTPKQLTALGYTVPEIDEVLFSTDHFEIISRGNDWHYVPEMSVLGDITIKSTYTILYEPDMHQHILEYISSLFFGKPFRRPLEVHELARPVRKQTCTCCRASCTVVARTASGASLGTYCAEKRKLYYAIEINKHDPYVYSESIHTAIEFSKEKGHADSNYVC